MRGKGITFDTGFLSAGTTTREPFDPEVVRREMRVIRDDLHCNAVRVTGGDPYRLKIAATHAADAGLEVWLCPFTNGLTQERLALVADPLRVRPMIGEVRSRINDFLRRAAQVVRARFGGKVSYASLPLEGVDWAPFDIIATDAAYRTKEIAPHFRENIRAFVAQGRAQGKPVAIMEFGCTTHRGAADGGGDSLVEGAIIVWGDDGRPARLNGEYVRDEGAQATYLREVLEVFEAEGVDNAFVNTFARYDLPHRSDPSEDFDLASFGVVKVLDGQGGARGERYPDMPWEPKTAFTTLADFYSRCALWG